MTDLYQYQQCGEPNRPRRLLCHASHQRWRGRKSRPSAVRLLKRCYVYAQPRTVKQNLVYQVLQANPLSPLLWNSQVMQGNHNNSSLTIADWEGSDKYSFANNSQIKCVHCKGVKPRDKTITQSNNNASQH